MLLIHEWCRSPGEERILVRGIVADEAVARWNGSRFSNATCNPAAVHLDYEYRKTTEFGRPLIDSIFTLGLMIGFSVQETTLGTPVANLGMSNTRFPAPVFAGDTIRSRTTVKEMRESESRPNAGIVTLLHQGYNQRNEEICVCTRQALMLKTPT